LSNIAAETQRMVSAGADFVHLDIFDGHWIRGAFTFGPMVVKALRARVPGAFLDAHLCVTEPARYIEELADAGADRFTFHVEAVPDPRAVARRVRAAGMKVGLALSPDTPAKGRVMDLAAHFDVVLVMTVRPGFGGQAFMPEVLSKVRELRSAFPDLPIEVDGGVNAETISLAAAAGASEAVAGTAVFRAEDPAATIRDLRERLGRRPGLPA